MSLAKVVGARLLMPILFVSLIITGCDTDTSSDMPSGDINQNSGTVSGTGDEGSTASDIRTIIKRVPDAENACFTDSGRLFVSGGTNVYEITGPESAIPLFKEGDGMYGGMAQVGKWLYINTSKMKSAMQPIDLKEMLTAGDLIAKLKYLMENLMDLEITRVDLSAGTGHYPSSIAHRFVDMFMPNGMAADAEGRLYVTDETFLPQGKIVRITFSGDENPVSTQETWISREQGCLSPNGIVIRDNIVYFTDFVITSTDTAAVKKVPILDGKPGTVELIYAGPGLDVYDDLDVGMYKGALTLAVTDFFGNNIIMIDDAKGEVWRVGNGKFQNPSSAHFGVGPLFAEKDLVITEKGILMENYSNIGNRLSTITLP